MFGTKVSKLSLRIIIQYGRVMTQKWHFDEYGKHRNVLYAHLSCVGLRVDGTYPSMHWERGRAHAGEAVSPITL